MDDDERLVERAYAAYFRHGSAEISGLRQAGYTASLNQPASGAQVEEVGGLRYIALRNVNGILAVYRVGNNGQLRRLKRWPSELELQ